MIFRQLYDAATSTLSYLVADEASGQAALIDCVFEQHLRDLALIRELGLKLQYTLETHVHADHVTGAWLMKQAVGSQIAVATGSGATGFDVGLGPGDVLGVGDLRIEVRSTPGHTDGCLTYVLPEQRMAFTGDALLIRGAGRTDFQQGDPAKLFRSVREQIFSLPDDFALYPGHDYSGRTSTTVKEERQHNPRLGDRVREQDFIGYMNNLGLPHPNRLKEAVPANLLCGKPTREADAPKTPVWGPVIRTYAGVWQIEPEWVNEHLGELQLIDVRAPEEVEASSMGQLHGSRQIPLSRLRDEIAGLEDEPPIVFVCPAGARSAIAATIAEQAGLHHVASLRGGILEWRALGLPID